jgi:hypothetical protein
MDSKIPFPRQAMLEVRTGALMTRVQSENSFDPRSAHMFPLYDAGPTGYLPIVPKCVRLDTIDRLVQDYWGNN